MKVFVKDARSFSSFSRVGYDYLKINETANYMIWEMRKDGKLMGWEIWIPKWFKNPDDNTVWRKPSDEDFGTFAWHCTSMDAVNNRIRKIEEQINQQTNS